MSFTALNPRMKYERLDYEERLHLDTFPVLIRACPMCVAIIRKLVKP